MFAYWLIVFELAFLLFALFTVLRNHADQFKVSKDIWGLYQQPEDDERTQKNQEQMPVLIFSKSKTSVLVLLPGTDHDPKSPSGATRYKKAA